MLRPPPPRADALHWQVVRIASLAAALAKPNVKIPIEDLIKVIQDEDEAKRVKVTAEVTQRGAALRLSERKSACHACSLTTNLANAGSRSPTNWGNYWPQIHYRLQVRPQAYQTRPCRSIGFWTLPNSPFPTARFQIRSN